MQEHHNVYVDGILKQWGDIVDLHQKPRRVKNSEGFKSELAPKKPPVQNSAAIRNKLNATTKRVPEVMVKISGGGKDRMSIKAHLDYISRNGKVEIEDEKGQVFNGIKEVRRLHEKQLKIGNVPLENGKRKETHNIILSMPPGTDREAVKVAARNFAAEAFEGRQYVFAAHDDQKHPHVHIAVKSLDRNGLRLNPRKNDIQRWREIFAEKLSEQGIEANATPRKLRGIVRKGEKQAVRNMNKGYYEGKRKQPSQTLIKQQINAQNELKGIPVKNPAHNAIKAQRTKVMSSYLALAKALESSTEADKKLAAQTIKFVKSMPEPITLHEKRVRDMTPKPVDKDIERK